MGGLDILTEGRAVFQLTEMLDEKEYYEGAVEYLADTVPLRRRAPERGSSRRSRQCHALLFGQALDDLRGRDTADSGLSHGGARCRLELEKRQALLEMRIESERRAVFFRWAEKASPRRSHKNIEDARTATANCGKGSKDGPRGARDIGRCSFASRSERAEFCLRVAFHYNGEVTRNRERRAFTRSR